MDLLTTTKALYLVSRALGVTRHEPQIVVGKTAPRFVLRVMVLIARGATMTLPRRGYAAIFRTEDTPHARRMHFEVESDWTIRESENTRSVTGNKQKSEVQVAPWLL